MGLRDPGTGRMVFGHQPWPWPVKGTEPSAQPLRTPGDGGGQIHTLPGPHGDEGIYWFILQMSTMTVAGAALAEAWS